MIPGYVDGLNLPVGGHLCSLSELEERFAWNDRRKRLFEVLVNVIRLAKRCGFLHALLGGSFPTAKDLPDDIDVTWFCAPGTDKTTVDEECIQIMEDRSEDGNFQYVPFDAGSGHEQRRAKLDLWSSHWGFDAKTGGLRGVILLDLGDDDPRFD